MDLSVVGPKLHRIETAPAFGRRNGRGIVNGLELLEELDFVLRTPQLVQTIECHRSSPLTACASDADVRIFGRGRHREND